MLTYKEAREMRDKAIIENLEDLIKALEKVKSPYESEEFNEGYERAIFLIKIWTEGRK